MRHECRFAENAAWVYLGIGLASGSAIADVVRDGTIGPNTSVQSAGPNFEIVESMGEVRGGNLFHSFDKFSIGMNESATFSGAQSISNIISRVTGADASQIDGTLRSTIPGAALYLMNPKGIVFGPGAQLDLQGAFHAGATSALEFQNGEVLSASNNSMPILSLSSPEKFGFLGEIADVDFRGSILSNVGGIAVSGRSVNLQYGASLVSRAIDSTGAGHIALSATGKIILSGTGKNGAGAGLEVEYQGESAAPRIRVEASVIELRDGAMISTNAIGKGRADVSVVTAGERITLVGHDRNGVRSRIQAQSQAGGDVGTLRIHAPVIELQDGAQLTSVAHGSGDGGEMIVTATERITLSGKNQDGLGASLQTLTTATATGKGGNLRVGAPIVEMRDGALLMVSLAGSAATATPAREDADAALVVQADQRLILSGINGRGQGARIEATALEQSLGRAVFIEAPVIRLADGAVISSASLGISTAGAIRIHAEELLELTDGSEITSSTQTTSGGNIRLESGGLLHLRDSKICTGVGNGKGKGGDIFINHDAMVLNRSEVSAHADWGEGGSIRITADAVLKSTGSDINATARPEGIDGEIVTRAPIVDFTSDVAPTQTAYLDASELLRPRCDSRRTHNTAGTFRVASGRGLPLSPEDILMTFDPSFLSSRSAGLAQYGKTDSPTVLAAAAFEEGQFERASKYWAQAAAYAKDNAHAQGEAMRGVAASQQVLGFYDASLKTLMTALAQAEAAQDKMGVAAAQGLIGNAYLALNDADAAERWLRGAIDSARAANDPALAVTLLNNLGNHHMVAQDFAAALRAYETAANQAREPDQRAKALSNASRAALELGQMKQSLALLTQAREDVRLLRAGHAKIGVLIHVAKSSVLLGEMTPSKLRSNFSAAYAGLREAALLSRALNDPRSLSYALGNLGRLYQLDHRAEEALYLTRLAEQAAEQARAPDALYRWHRQTGQILATQGNLDAAIVAYRRAVAILEESRQETLAQYGAAHARFRQIVAPVYEELVDVLLQRAERLGNVEEGAKLLLEARATVEQFKAAELRDYFRNECVAELEAKTTRLEAVSPHAAVIYPIVLPDRLELLVSLHTGLKRFSVPVSQATLSAAVRRFHDAIKTRDTEARVRVAGRTLYDWLIEPFVSELGEVDTLVFVPGGILRTVPLAALFDGDDYLVQRYRVVVTPGLSLTAPRPFQGGDGNAKVVLAGLSAAVQSFPALPAVEQELEQVQQIFGGRVLLNEAFTAAQLKQSLNEPVSIVHIASHAQFTGNAESSFLLTYDGRLSMADLEEYLSVTRFRAEPLELLVLSACQTAAGDERAALGLAGIGIKAGARSAVGSLWAITDIAASEFVTEFYRQLKDPSASKAQALQGAQQRLLNSKRYAHPYYWSPYLLVNNWL